MQSQKTLKVIEKFRAVHGMTYDYSGVVYTKNSVKMRLWCPKHLEHFLQTPAKHLAGQGCPKCGFERRTANQTGTLEEFVSKASAMPIHKNIDYSDVVYKNNRTPVKLRCLVHGFFHQRPDNHLSGNTCPKCSDDVCAGLRSLTCAEFINKSKLLPKHKDINYEKTEYISRTKSVLLTCLHHGDFWQRAGDHLEGNSCPKCASVGSSGERALQELLDNLGVEYLPNNRTLLGGKELDIYIPSHKLAIEYNGSFWHSEHPHAKGKDARNHLADKHRLCSEVGVHLLHIMDMDNPLVVRKLIASRLGCDDETIGARKCSVVVGIDAKGFYNNNHVQGNVTGCVVYSLYYRGQMVAAMSFSSFNSVRGQKKDDRFWELRRFATVCKVPGGASRLLKAFLNDNPQCKEVISYSDNRLFSGGMYSKLGFELVSESGPDYKYIKSQTLLPKSRFKRSNLVKMKGFDFKPEETELENCKRNGWWRVWDCGKKKWSLKTK